MAKLSSTLGEWPLPYIRVRCRKCPNLRFFMKGPVLRKYGADFLMPDLSCELMACDRRSYNDYCGAYFSDALALDIAEHGPIESDATSAYPKGAGRG